MPKTLQTGAVSYSLFPDDDQDPLLDNAIRQFPAQAEASPPSALHIPPSNTSNPRAEVPQLFLPQPPPLPHRVLPKAHRLMSDYF